MQRSITTPIPRRTLIAAAVLIVLFAATLVLPGSHQSWAADEISETMYDFSVFQSTEKAAVLVGSRFGSSRGGIGINMVRKLQTSPR